MFETYKLKKYLDKIICFTYECTISHGANYCIKTYLVVNINKQVKLIPYKKSIVYTSPMADLIISDLEKIGYKNLVSLMDNKPKTLKLKSR